MNNVLAKMKIGVLCGGWSDERSISLNSGNSVYESLIDNGYNAYIFDFKKNEFEMLSSFLSSNKIDLIFNLIHGTGGEDGTVQAWLDDIGINYVGSDTESSKLSFSKIMTKQKWVDNGLKTPAYAEKLSSIIAGNENQSLFFGDTTKYVLKPDKSGSSVGIKIFNNVKDLSMALSSISSYDEYFVEEYVEGHEYTAPIIGNTVFPIIKIETKREFYDYQAKYIDDDTSFTFPEFESDMLEKIESDLPLISFSET